MPERERWLGAIFDTDTTTFRVWAPDRQQVDLVVESPGGSRSGGDPRTRVRDVRPLVRDDLGYWSLRVADLGPGARYRYRLDRSDEQVFPDPASRRQPDGVHGPSEVVDPAAFSWTDERWRPPSLRDIVFYELHVGTFSPEGTFRAAIERLPHLTRLGVTAIELMPIADFPGTRNWGYDGVAIFAPSRCYGAPDDLRSLVDAAHGHGLAVVLDVVYNHFGPDGAYANAFSPYYLTTAHGTPWGRGINLDGPHSPEVRRFFIENALHWVNEYHVDALRLDATHTLRDCSTVHFLADLTTTVRAHAERDVLFVAEDHRNLAHMLRPAHGDGFGIDAVWADDLHHELHVHATGEHEGYYADYSGTTADIAATLRRGWFFTGQTSPHLGGPRGTDPGDLPYRQFVACLQNHDQIGNRVYGTRLHHEIDPAVFRALTAVLIAAPQTPLLFMGQEWAAGTPFLFFTDHQEELGRLVTAGRRQEFGAFAAFADPLHRAGIPDPQAPETFARSRLDWDELDRDPHARTLRLYQRLLALRRTSPALRFATRETCEARTLDEHSIALSFAAPPAALVGSSDVAEPVSRAQPCALHIVVRLSGNGPRTVAIRCAPDVETVVTTEDPEFVDTPEPIRVTVESADTDERGTVPAGMATCEIVFARPGAIVLRSR